MESPHKTSSDDNKKLIANYGYIIYTKDGVDPKFPIVIRDSVFYESPANRESLESNINEVKDNNPLLKTVYANVMPKKYLERMISEMMQSIEEEIDIVNAPEQVLIEQLPFVLGKELYYHCADGVSPQGEISF